MKPPRCAALPLPLAKDACCWPLRAAAARKTAPPASRPPLLAIASSAAVLAHPYPRCPWLLASREAALPRPRNIFVSPQHCTIAQIAAECGRTTRGRDNNASSRFRDCDAWTGTIASIAEINMWRRGPAWPRCTATGASHRTRAQLPCVPADRYFNQHGHAGEAAEGGERGGRSSAGCAGGQRAGGGRPGARTAGDGRRTQLPRQLAIAFDVSYDHA